MQHKWDIAFFPNRQKTTSHTNRGQNVKDKIQNIAKGEVKMIFLRETILFQTFSSRQWVRELKLFCSRQHFSSHSVTDNIVPDKTKCQGLFQTKYIACFFTETMSQIIFFQTSNLLT